MPKNTADDPKQEYCKRCDRTFIDYKSLVYHKRTTPAKHLICSKCDQEYNSQEGLNLHYKEHHAAKQDLTCHGCGLRFTRAGGLVNHFEKGNCKTVSKEDFEHRRGIQTRFHKTYAHDNASGMPMSKEEYNSNRGKSTGTGNSSRHFPGGSSQNYTGDSSRKYSGAPTPKANDGVFSENSETSGGGVPVGVIPPSFISRQSAGNVTPTPSVKVRGWANDVYSSPSTNVDNAWGTLSGQSNTPGTPTTGPAAKVGSDATIVVETEMTWVEATRLANIEAQKAAAAKHEADFPQLYPRLPNQEFKSGGLEGPDLLSDSLSTLKIKETSLWNGNAELFPQFEQKQFSAPRQPAHLNQSIPAPPKKIYREFDPNDPNFNIHSCYNPITNKFKCPYPRCGKVWEKKGGLVGHLHSPAHAGKKFRCPKCLRLFDSATALVQHAESQAVKCDIRKSDEYRQALDQIAGGVVDTDGLHEDTTVKYVAPKEGVENIMKHGPAFADAAQEKHDTYWRDRADKEAEANNRNVWW